MPKKSPLRQQFISFHRSIDQFHSTPGYSHLSDYQRRFITSTLYWQMRFDRSNTSLYPIAAHINTIWYCHLSVATLEQGLGAYHLPQAQISHEFFDGPSVKMGDYRSLVQFVQSIPTPSVIHVSTYAENYGLGSHMHTCLYLGPTVDREPLIWEKSGFSLPFRLATLHDLYTAYSRYSPHWRLRPLKYFDT